MVQKYQSPVRVYKYPFEMVMAAYEKRFPTCKMIPIFVGCDILSEEKGKDDSTHVIARRCKLNVDAPRLLKRMVGVDYVYFVQKNDLNRRERKLTITAYNETFANRVSITESCQYTVHPENPEWTCFEQVAEMEIKSFFGFESTVEKIAMKQYTSNIKKGKEIIEYYLNELISEGVTYIPTWAEEHPELAQRSSEEDESPLCTGFAKSEKVKASLSRTSSTTTGDMEHLCGDRTAGGVAEDKLDEEYIEQKLGVLAPMEESKLIQLRNWLSETHGTLPRDEHILRFLRARDFNLEKAREMICQSLSWRKLHQVDRLLETWKPPSIFDDYYCGTWHHHDIEGRPLYILRIGQMDTKGLLKAIGQDQILKQVLYIMEQGLKKCQEASNALSKPMSSWSCIVDLEGLNMRHLWRPAVQALLKIIEVIENNYPETMARLLIVRAPRVFPVIWTLISHFIDEKTRSKFMLYGGTDYLGPGGLVDYVPHEYIPDFLGGPCECPISEGGFVPKSMYRAEWEKADNPQLMEESIYKTASVIKGSPHEIILDVPAKECVITWDFDILKCDVVFSLYHTDKKLGTGELSQQRSMAVVFGIFVAVHVVFGTIGNVMVIVAIRQSRRLQSKSDYLIGSLAVADLLVSAIVVPFAACVVFQEEDPSSFPWINSIFCGVFIFLDVSCCTVSILHLCAIAWVRYQSVTNIRNAFKTVSLRSVLPLVSCLWTLASVLSIMPFLIFGSMTNTNSTTRDTGNSSTSDASDSLHCRVVTNKVYRVIATTVAFYAPLLVILIIYTKMAKIAWAKARERGIHSSQKKKHRKKGTAQGESITNSKTKQCKGVGNDAMVCLRSPEAQNTITGAETPSSCSVPEYCSEADTIESSCGTNETSSVRVRLKRERRILLTLGMIIGAFIVCWLPFFVKEIVIAFCSCSIPPLVEVIINWLGYINSVLNPVIYAYTNKDFNDAFRKMWCRKR